MNEFTSRTLSGAVYVAIILTSLLLGPMAFASLSAVFIILATRELTRLIHGKDDGVFFIWMISLSLLLFFSGLNAFWFRYLRTSTSGIIILSGLIPVFILIFSKAQTTIASILNYMLLWLLVPLFFLVAMLDPFRQGEVAPDYALGAFVFIWVNDTFAYLTGKLFGRTPLWPSISPKKTIEGLAGGLIMAAIAGFIWAQYFPRLSPLQWIIFALAGALAGTAGDLYESYVKRKAGVKDAGDIIPGHGGILDRIDSILFAAPVLFLLIILYFA